MNATMANERNLDFLIRSAVWVGRADGLLGIKRHQGFIRIDKIIEQKKKNRAVDFSIILNVIMMPGIVFLTGLIIIKKRKKHDA
jgi:uncharacterized membrane protein YidH (DUF202 family)